MSAINWRKMSDERPNDEQKCLTQMKHGIIQGYYDAQNDTFCGYYWQDMEWRAGLWVPIEEVQP